MPGKTRESPPVLWKHQEEAVAFAQTKRGAILALEMGLGKTFCALELARRWEAQQVLVLAPLSVVDEVWPKEIERHAPGEFVITALGAAARGTVAKKTDRAKGGAQYARAHRKKHIVVLNYESAWRQPLAGWLKSQQWDLLIMDESHRIKNPGSKQSLLCSQLYTCTKRRLALTGTPMPQGPLDIYAQCRAVDRSQFGVSYQNFKHQYSQPHPLYDHQFVYKNMGIFQQKFREVALEMKARDRLDLPEAIDSQRTAELSPKARRLYDEMDLEFKAWLTDSQEITAANVMTRVIRLQQIASGFTVDSEGETVPDIDDGKANALADILEDMPPGEPCVVFARFKENLRTIEKNGRSLRPALPRDLRSPQGTAEVERG